jgi:hypothetical protein
VRLDAGAGGWRRRTGPNLLAEPVLAELELLLGNESLIYVAPPGLNANPSLPPLTPWAQ